MLVVGVGGGGGGGGGWADASFDAKGFDDGGEGGGGWVTEALLDHIMNNNRTLLIHFFSQLSAGNG